MVQRKGVVAALALAALAKGTAGDCDTDCGDCNSCGTCTNSAMATGCVWCQAALVTGDEGIDTAFGACVDATVNSNCSGPAPSVGTLAALYGSSLGFNPIAISFTCDDGDAVVEAGVADSDHCLVPSSWCAATFEAASTTTTGGVCSDVTDCTRAELPEPSGFTGTYVVNNLPAPIKESLNETVEAYASDSSASTEATSTEATSTEATSTEATSTEATSAEESTTASDDPTSSVADGSTESVTDGTTVSVTDGTTVSVTDGTTVSVTDGTTVSVTDGTTVSVTEGTTVSVTTTTTAPGAPPVTGCEGQLACSTCQAEGCKWCAVGYSRQTISDLQSEEYPGNAYGACIQTTADCSSAQHAPMNSLVNFQTTGDETVIMRLYAVEVASGETCPALSVGQLGCSECLAADGASWCSVNVWSGAKDAEAGADNVGEICAEDCAQWATWGTGSPTMEGEVVEQCSDGFRAAAGGGLVAAALLVALAA